MLTASQFLFKKLDTIGAADAEDDRKILLECFVDTGDLQILKDCSDPRRLVLARTGFGKTALLQKLAENSSGVINIKPESLALSYISNSTILKFVSQLGVKLDIFYRLLWRHVFVVELLQAHLKIINKEVNRSVVDTLKEFFFKGQNKHKKAIEYLEKWGKSFWEATDYRIKELTTKLESDLSTSMGLDAHAIKAETSVASKLSEEKKAELIQRAQNVVNEVQITELSDIIDLMDELLSDPLRPYYIIIDRLDENWVEERQKYLLIRALIETARDFRHIRHCKIIVALRVDLVDRVFRLTRDAGFQQEKYESIFLHVTWTVDQLTQVLDSRINRLVQQRYTKQSVTHKDIMPVSIDGESAISYLLKRTMMRPRDVILFFNTCIARAIDHPTLTGDLIKDAEGEYSRLRLISVAEEWAADYPNLILATDILKNRPTSFAVSDVCNSAAEELALQIATTDLERADDISSAANQVCDEIISPLEFVKIIAQIFYRTGIVGLKLEKLETITWSLSGRRTVSHSDVDRETKIVTHPCFWRRFSTRLA